MKTRHDVVWTSIMCCFKRPDAVHALRAHHKDVARADGAAVDVVRRVARDVGLQEGEAVHAARAQRRGRPIRGQHPGRQLPSRVRAHLPRVVARRHLVSRARGGVSAAGS